MLTSLAFPCLFYLFLNAGEQKAKQKRRKREQKAKANGLAIAVDYDRETKYGNETEEWEEGDERANWSE